MELTDLSHAAVTRGARGSQEKGLTFWPHATVAHPHARGMRRGEMDHTVMIGSGPSAGFWPIRRFLLFYVSFSISNLLFEFEFVSEFHTHVKCTIKITSMRRYIHLYIIIIIITLIVHNLSLFILFSFLFPFSNFNFLT
jgi:hypothetical protein